MSTPLQRAIDALFAFIDDHPVISDTLYNRGAVHDEPPEAHRTFYDEMMRRSSLVRDAAWKADLRLLALMPTVQVSFVADPPTTFHGACNLPGQWVKNPNRPAEPAKLRWGPDAALIGWREQMLALHAAAGSQPVWTPLPNGTVVADADVPAAYRDGCKPKGKPLTGSYLKTSLKWGLRGPYLSKHSTWTRGNKGKDVILKHYIKLDSGEYVYVFVEVKALFDRKTGGQEAAIARGISDEPHVER